MTVVRWHRLLIAGLLLAAIARPSASSAQDAAPSPDQEPHRIFGLIPNYRTSPTLQDYHPLGAKETVKMAFADSLDRGTFALAAVFAAEAQLTMAEPSFGTGVAGYSRYYAASLTDFVGGDLMTEAVYPVLLRQDPRYFRRGTGNAWLRLGYAMGQIALTHGDSGSTQFNASEIAGNATAVAIGNAYYRDNRGLSNSVTKLGIQLGVDALANILKEFSPDLERKFSHSTHARGVLP